MKRSFWLIALSCLVLLGGIYAFVIVSSYEEDADLLGFPVPQNAKLVEKNEFGKNFDWSKASGDDGIPWSYKVALKFSGWEKVEGELTPIYQKDGKQIDLIASRDHLSVLKVK